MSEDNNEKSALVPRLRFPEFREAAEWKQQTLADVCLQITNGKANAEDHEDGGIYPLYDRSEVVKKSSEFVFDDEAVIIPGEGMRFQPKYHKGKFNLHQRAYALMQHQGAARFVYYTMDRFKDTLAKNAVKSTVLSLRLPIIERFSLAVPSKAEQQKIADCLSSLDELIAAETQTLTALKTHKKGLMQQLFPCEGETVPRLRFPEFREAGEWENKTLADVCLKITNGKANAEDHENDGIYPLYDRSEVVKRSSEYVFDDEAVIIPGEGMRFQPKYYKGKFNLHQRAYALMQHQGSAGFVYYTLDRFKDTLAKNAVKSTVLSLRLPIIERFSLAVPHKDEQQKIADCLSSLDELITAETHSLAVLKTHKKGLMQQLFPVLDEVQG